MIGTPQTVVASPQVYNHLRDYATCCWRKAYILPRGTVNNLISLQGKVKREKYSIEPEDISAIVEKVSKRNQHSVSDSFSCAEFIDAAHLRRWVTIEDEESIREVLVNVSFDVIENCLMGITQANDEIEEASADETTIVSERLPPLSDVAQLFGGRGFSGKGRCRCGQPGASSGRANLSRGLPRAEEKWNTADAHFRAF